MTDDELRIVAAAMESIGRNCEVGLVQRHFGLEPHGLLRFAHAPRTALMRGLELGFRGIGENLTLHDDGREWLGEWNGLDFHLNEPLATSAYTTQARVGPILDRLGERLIEDIQAARKLLVYADIDGMTRGEAIELHDAVRAIGPASLLVVTQDIMRPGHIEALRPGLFVGHVERLTPWNAAIDLDIGGWRELLAEVPRHWRPAPLDAPHLAHQAMAARASLMWVADRLPDDAGEARSALGHAAMLIGEVESALRGAG